MYYLMQQYRGGGSKREDQYNSDRGARDVRQMQKASLPYRRQMSTITWEGMITSEGGSPSSNSSHEMASARPQECVALSGYG